MAEYRIVLGVKLNTADIRSQISKYKTKTPVKVDVKLNTKSLSSQIKAINSKTPVKVELKLNTSNAKKQINEIRRLIQQLGNIRINLGGTGRSSSSGIKNVVNDANWAYRQMLDIQKKASSLSLRINGLDTSRNVNELKELSLQFARLKSDYEALRSVFGSQLSTAQWGNLQAVLTDTEAKLSAMDAKFADTRANLARGIQLKLADGTFVGQIEGLEGKFSRLSNKSIELRNGITQVRLALDAMITASDSGDTEALISAETRYQAALKAVENQLRINASLEQRDNNSATLTQAKESLYLRINNWLKNNSAAAQQFGGELRNIQAQLQRCGNVAAVSKLNRDFNNIKLQAKEAGVATQTLGDKLRTQFSKYATYFSVASVILYSIQALKSMFNQVKAVDTAMTELKKVTDETESSYNKFLTNAASRAKELGTTIDGLVSSTADFARLGYGFEDAQGLAEVANIYAVVGDEVEGVEGATKSLISTMAAFKEQQEDISNNDFAMEIIDKFNEIGKLIA